MLNLNFESFIILADCTLTLVSMFVVIKNIQKLTAKQRRRPKRLRLNVFMKN